MNESIKKSFWFNLLMIILLCVVLYYVFFASLGLITRHGKEVKVPGMIGRDMKTAVKELEKMGFDVDIDSAYNHKVRAFQVLSQIPDSGSTVKEGRTIFLTVNKATPPLTPMPNLLHLSYRSAIMLIRSNKLVLGDTTYKPDIADGAILSQQYKGREVRPGELIPQGSRIDLVIGDGLGNVQMNVPDVIGMTYIEAINFLSAYGLQYTTVWDGYVTDSATAIVYYQEPNAINELGSTNRIKPGDFVDIRVKQDPSNEELEHNRNPNAAVNNDEDETEDDGFQ